MISIRLELPVGARMGVIALSIPEIHVSSREHIRMQERETATTSHYTRKSTSCKGVMLSQRESFIPRMKYWGQSILGGNDWESFYPKRK